MCCRRHAQSIYSFRGANINNILNFQKDFPDSKLLDWSRIIDPQKIL